VCWNIEDRYLALRSVAQSQALLQFGLSLFRKISPKRFSVLALNFHMLCAEVFEVTPESLTFLVLISTNCLLMAYPFEEDWRSLLMPRKRIPTKVQTRISGNPLQRKER